MSQPTHTYGPTCHFAKPITSTSNGDDDIPDLHAQFFYNALYHIDDPLSAAPTSTASDIKSAKHPPRAFSALDNNSLEAAWLGLGSEKDRKNHNKSKSRKAASRPHSTRLGSVVGTLASKVEQKKQPVKGGTSSNANASDVLVSKQPSSKITKKVSRFSADASSEHPSSYPTCACNGEHENCKSKSGQCACESCPKATAAAKTSHDNKVTPTAKQSAKLNAAPSALADEGPSSHGRKKGGVSDSASHPKTDTKGNPYNDRCNDPHHIPLDSEAPGCCSDFEGGKSMPAHTESKPPKGDGAKVSKSEPKQPKVDAAKQSKGKPESQTGDDAKQVKCELGACQGDGPSELASKVARPFKEKKAALPPALEPTCDLGGKEHAELERHENSEDHQAFVKHAKHFQSYEPAVETSEPFVNKQKASDRVTTPATTSALVYRPEQANDAGTTGKPFLKLPSRPTTPQPLVATTAPHTREIPAPSTGSSKSKSDSKRNEQDSTETEAVVDTICKAHLNAKDTEVPVGASRLHKVSLPALQLEPIYWSPVNDVAFVTRGTWFYKDTMLPVEPPVANQLEVGYRELRPWSQTWKDEMHSAMEVGAAGEEKVTHRLWPKDEEKTIALDDILSTDPSCAARCFQGEAAAEGAADPYDLNSSKGDTKKIVKKYPNCQVVYKDSRNAFILKPNLQPSAYHKRRPIHKINKGLAVGIHVCRGFDRRIWENLHSPKKNVVAAKVEEHPPVSGDSDISKGDSCPACRSQERPKECTDLCLVIHGIGQKLSERMESFNFTHAINAFRRAVNAEYCNEGVQKICREDLGGVMVLPVNWRSTLSFEDDDLHLKDGETNHSISNFTLNDITQPTIPAVRSMISDVMLDVPYYMSKNKGKMIQAAISEANRVYRLWCKNNPDFSKNGRVHIIAHSLGSVMAIEILSKQPTLVSRIDPTGKKANTKYFDFNTTNLFCVGSPAGFFLLLEKRLLTPRRGQNKTGAEVGDDKDKSIVGDQGTFGCIAVDNVYNVMHTNDPIAYRLNACADAPYAASLKEGRVPSATTGFFESLGNAMKILTPGTSGSTDLAVGQIPKPTLTARMPSQLEMEIHDFNAEERAEKKFYLLNDNGQMDYRLSSGGGPLEIQYLNMLGAHSSYWTSPDFIRMICTEVGKKPGRSNCFPNMKAVKIRHKS